MATTPPPGSNVGRYGYDPTGKQIYKPGMYDVSGEYMGMRGKADQRTDFWQNRNPFFDQWSPGGMSQADWTKNYMAQQRAKIGPRPPSPDEVAPRGTPEWRQAFANQQNWQETVAKWGGNRADMGLNPAKGKGLAGFNRWGQTDSSGRNMAESWADRGRAQAELYYNRAMGNKDAFSKAYMQREGISGQDVQNQADYAKTGVDNRVPSGGFGGGMSGMYGDGGWGGGGSFGGPQGPPAQGASQPFGGANTPWQGGNNPGFYGKSTNPNDVLRGALGEMNANRAAAAPVEQGLTGIYENILGGGAQGQAYLAPVSQGIMQQIEGQRAQIMATMPPGGQRDLALKQLSDSAATQVATARQNLIGQATQGLTDIYQKNKFYSDPLAQEAMRSGTQLRTTQMSLENQMKIAQMQNEMQKYGIDMSAETAANQLGLGYAQLGAQQGEFGQNLAWEESKFGQNLAWQQSQFGQNMAWDQSKFAQDLKERQREADQQAAAQHHGFLSSLFGGLGSAVAGAFLPGLAGSIFGGGGSKSSPQPWTPVGPGE